MHKYNTMYIIYYVLNIINCIVPYMVTVVLYRVVYIGIYLVAVIHHTNLCSGIVLTATYAYYYIYVVIIHKYISS